MARPEKEHDVDRKENGEIKMGIKTWKWLAGLKKSDFEPLSKHKSEVEKRQKKTFGPKEEPQWKCEECGKKFSTQQGRMSHYVRAHNVRSNQRKLVKEVENGDGKYQCLLCNGIYVNKKGAQLHIDRHCAKKFSPEEIAAKLIQYQMA